jgi:hypothetical protein
VTIDHVLYDRDRVGVIDFQVLDLPGSDHRTIYAGLVVGNPYAPSYSSCRLSQKSAESPSWRPIGVRSSRP